MYPMKATVRVGYTMSRPVVPDEFFAYVLTCGETETELTLIAAQMIACHAEMVTSTEIIELEM
jgi:hypothetical protein